MTNYDASLDDDTSINEVIDQLNDVPIPKLSEEKDLVNTKVKSNSENEEKNEVSDNDETPDHSVDTDDIIQNKDENKINSIISKKELSNYHRRNITGDGLDEQIDEANTIEPDKESKFKKQD